MIRIAKINWNDPNFFLTIIVPLCTNRTKKCIAYQLYSFTYDTKHGQQYTIKWQHEKWTFSIRIGHKNIYVWTHDTYTKVLGCKTWNNWPLMYTWIVKIAIDVALTSHMTSLQAFFWKRAKCIIQPPTPPQKVFLTRNFFHPSVPHTSNGLYTSMMRYLSIISNLWTYIYLFDFQYFVYIVETNYSIFVYIQHTIH